MKKVFTIIALAFSIVISAQKETKSKKTAIPNVVKEAFSKDYPNQKVKWSSENGGYEAEFKMNGVETSAVYDSKGHRKELETEIKVDQLPANALIYLKKNYPTSKISEAAKITDDKNVVVYEAEIKKDGKSFDVILDSNGNFIKIIEED